MTELTRAGAKRCWTASLIAMNRAATRASTAAMSALATRPPLFLFASWVLPASTVVNATSTHGETASPTVIDELSLRAVRLARRASARRARRCLTTICVIDLAAIRRAAGLTQTELAADLGVGQAQISKIERQGDMLISTLASYFMALGVDAQIVVEVGEQTVTYDLTTGRGER
jgi:DNA-binding XRE family transcriptional regulator